MFKPSHVGVHQLDCWMLSLASALMPWCHQYAVSSACQVSTVPTVPNTQIVRSIFFANSSLWTHFALRILSIQYKNMWFGAPFSTHLSINRQKGWADALKVGQTTVKNTASVGPSSLPGCTEKRKKARHYVWFSGTSKILENRVARFPVLCCMLELTTHTNPALLDYSHEILKTLTVNLLRTFPRLCTRLLCFTSRVLFTIHPLHASLTCGLLGSCLEPRSKLLKTWSSNHDGHDRCSTDQKGKHLKNATIFKMHKFIVNNIEM